MINATFCFLLFLWPILTLALTRTRTPNADRLQHVRCGCGRRYRHHRRLWRRNWANVVAGFSMVSRRRGTVSLERSWNYRAMIGQFVSTDHQPSLAYCFIHHQHQPCMLSDTTRGWELGKFLESNCGCWELGKFLGSNCGCWELVSFSMKEIVSFAIDSFCSLHVLN